MGISGWGLYGKICNIKKPLFLPKRKLHRERKFNEVKPTMHIYSSPPLLNS